MNSTPFKEQTRVLGAPQGWDANANGPCLGLPVHIDEFGFKSRWQPTWRERIGILFGRPVWLWVVGSAHPPVALEVHKTIFK